MHEIIHERHKRFTKLGDLLLRTSANISDGNKGSIALVDAALSFLGTIKDLIALPVLPQRGGILDHGFDGETKWRNIPAVSKCDGMGTFTNVMNQ